MWTINSPLEKNLILGKLKGRRRRGRQGMRWLDGITNAMDMNLSKLREMVRDREAWLAALHGVMKSRTWQLNNKKNFLWPKTPPKSQIIFSQNILLIVWWWVSSLYSRTHGFLSLGISAHICSQNIHPSLTLWWEVPGLPKIGYSSLSWAKNKSQSPWGTCSPTVTAISLVENTALPFPWPPLQRRKCFSPPSLPSLKDS